MNPTLTAPTPPKVARMSSLLASGGWAHRDDDAFTSLWTKTVDGRAFGGGAPLE